MLERNGADVLAFPALRAVQPADYGPMDEAIGKLRDFDWIILSGSNCVVNFLKRLKSLGLGKEAVMEHKLGAIGYGALSALKKEGVEVHYVPRLHTAEGVTEGLGAVAGKRFLLVRVEGASPGLCEKLKSLGAEVREVAGYRMLVEASAHMAEEVFGSQLHALALANPTAVRFLIKATNKLGINLKDSLEGVTIAAVGPVTAEVATRHGLAPDIISKGHIADLAKTLTDFLRS
jgi:uroporphyrinogen-III synthase